jgi:hypothetical protein
LGGNRETDEGETGEDVEKASGLGVEAFFEKIDACKRNSTHHKDRLSQLRLLFFDTAYINVGIASVTTGSANH